MKSWTESFQATEEYKQVNALLPTVLATLKQIGLEAGDAEDFSAGYLYEAMQTMQVLNTNDSLALGLIVIEFLEMIATEQFIGQFSPLILLSMINYLSALLLVNGFNNLAELEASDKRLTGLEHEVAGLIHRMLRAKFLAQEVEQALTDFLTHFTTF